MMAARIDICAEQHNNVIVIANSLSANNGRHDLANGPHTGLWQLQIPREQRRGSQGNLFITYTT
jgi:hypothetical protein